MLVGGSGKDRTGQDKTRSCHSQCLHQAVLRFGSVGRQKGSKVVKTPGHNFGVLLLMTSAALATDHCGVLACPAHDDGSTVALS